MGRKEDSRKLVNKSALYGAGLGLLPFRFAAPAVTALGIKMLKDIQDLYGAEVTSAEQIVAAALLGSGEFALSQASRAARLVPWVGKPVSAVMTGVALKAMGEGAIAYYTWARTASEVDARPATGNTPGTTPGHTPGTNPGDASGTTPRVTF